MGISPFLMCRAIFISSPSKYFITVAVTTHADEYRLWPRYVRCSMLWQFVSPLSGKCILLPSTLMSPVFLTLYLSAYLFAYVTVYKLSVKAVPPSTCYLSVCLLTHTYIVRPVSMFLISSILICLLSVSISVCMCIHISFLYLYVYLHILST
jgi:hypothetical protein